MRFDPVATYTNNTNEIVKVTQGDRCWLLKRYQGNNALGRRNTEQARLRLWGSKGFPVPALYDLDLPEQSEPYLVLEWIDGISLAQLLNDESLTMDKRLQQLEKIIKDIYGRQSQNLQQNDYRFIHSDPNTGNILIKNGNHFYIDFEGCVTSSSNNITEALAIELAKFLRWSIRDLGRRHLQDVINRVIAIYGSDDPIIIAIYRRVYRSPWQFVHRFKDRKKKKNNPGDVTKYDLADAFHSALVG